MGGGGDNWSYKSCKTPVRSSQSTTTNGENNTRFDGAWSEHVTLRLH